MAQSDGNLNVDGRLGRPETEKTDRNTTENPLVGVIHLKELKFPSDLLERKGTKKNVTNTDKQHTENLGEANIIKRDRWHNLLNLNVRTSVRTEQKITGKEQSRQTPQTQG
jgi:hypothetical protein